MKYRAGTLKVLCAWMVILLPSLDAGNATKEHAFSRLCKPRELSALTKSLIETSLTGFDEANGQHLGTWSPGFPELQVQKKTPLVPSNVQCSLLFASEGLGAVLEDQKSNLNPTDVSLHKELEDTVSHLNMLAKCVKHILGGECSPRPAPPKMPTYVFERKQWSHTLLKTAREYLNWLEHKFEVNGMSNMKRYVVKYLEGSRYLL